MKHAVKGKQLNRNIHTRRALFKNLMLSLIQYGQIKTTLAKAKAIQGAFEKMLTKAKKGTIQNRRLIDETLNQHYAVNRLVDIIAPASKRAGGDTRIVKLGNRRGDDATMVRLEIIDWKPEVVVPVKKKTKSSNTEKVKEEAKKADLSSTKIEDKPISKVKRPMGASSQVKHIPQKRIAGGGK